MERKGPPSPSCPVPSQGRSRQARSRWSLCILTLTHPPLHVLFTLVSWNGTRPHRGRLNGPRQHLSPLPFYFDANTLLQPRHRRFLWMRCSSIRSLTGHSCLHSPLPLSNQGWPGPPARSPVSSPCGAVTKSELAKRIRWLLSRGLKLILYWTLRFIWFYLACCGFSSTQSETQCMVQYSAQSVVQQ